MIRRQSKTKFDHSKRIFPCSHNHNRFLILRKYLSSFGESQAHVIQLTMLKPLVCNGWKGFVFFMKSVQILLNCVYNGGYASFIEVSPSHLFSTNDVEKIIALL